MAARQNIMEWMVGISGALKGNRSGTLGGRNRTTAEGDATVTQLGIDGSDQQSWKLHSLWPTELGEVPLDWSSDAIEEYTVAFAYDYWSKGVIAEDKKTNVGGKN